MHCNRNVLLTGAAGRIGSTFFKASHERFTFRLTDLPYTFVQADAPHEVMLADLSDINTCKELCNGIDTVVHLAGIPSPDATFEATLEHNIKVTRNVFEAARTQICKRVVVASRQLRLLKHHEERASILSSRTAHTADSACGQPQNRVQVRRPSWASANAPSASGSSSLFVTV